jgi:hypothetical protein
MATLAEQQAALEEALAAGVKRVKFRDREVEYPSVEEIQRALADVRSRLNGTSGRRVAQLHRGFGPEDC